MLLHRGPSPFDLMHFCLIIARADGKPGFYPPYEIVFGHKNNLNSALGGEYDLEEVDVRFLQ